MKEFNVTYTGELTSYADIPAQVVQGLLNFKAVDALQAHSRGLQMLMDDTDISEAAWQTFDINVQEATAFQTANKTHLPDSNMTDSEANR